MNTLKKMKSMRTSNRTYNIYVVLSKMIGNHSDKVHYINSVGLKGIKVTRQDIQKLRDENPDENDIIEEAQRITYRNAELKNLDPEYVVVIYRKMKHLDTIKTHLMNIGLIASADISGKIVPMFVTRIFHSIQNNCEDVSFYVMKVFEPNYKITRDMPEERTLATCGDREMNVIKIMNDLEIPSDLARGVDKIYRDGMDFSSMFLLCTRAYKTYRYGDTMTVNAELSDI